MLNVSNSDKIMALKASARGYVMIAKSLPEYAVDAKRNALAQAKKCLDMANSIVPNDIDWDETKEYKIAA